MHQSSKNDPLHGITLQKILEHLESNLGWDKMAQAVKINCFSNDPSIKSSLKFLRKTPWARTKVEQLYLETTRAKETKSKPTGPDLSDFSWPDAN